jgi:hypothetical protein
MTAKGIKAPVAHRQVFPAHGSNQQSSRIIIGAVAMDAIGDGMGGMLQNARIIGKGFQVIKLHSREIEICDGFDVFNI